MQIIVGLDKVTKGRGEKFSQKIQNSREGKGAKETM